jgi:hypothetical protein
MHVTESLTISFANYFTYNDQSSYNTCIYTTDALFYGTYSNASNYYNSPPYDVNLIDVLDTPFTETFNGGYGIKSPTLIVTASSYNSADLPY